MKKRILVLSAKTGGGHRAAAEAVICALEGYHDKVEIIHLDFMEYAPRPIRDMPRYYSQIVKVPPAYGTIFKLTEGQRQARFAIDTISKRYHKEIASALTLHKPDIIVSFHFGANVFLPVMQSLNSTAPFITVVTDLVSGHPMWFDARADLCIVPSIEAYDRARSYNMPDAKLRIIGLPVKKDFAMLAGEDRVETKQSLGWPTDLKTVLVMAGGDGMGKIASLTRRLDTLPDSFHIAVVAGRNQKLVKKLHARSWNHPTDVYGFRDDIAHMMFASDVLLTKAGPGTIAEAIVAHLPIVLYDFLPGQEEGNIEYVVNNQAGLWASSNSIAARATIDILERYAQIGGKSYEKVAKLHAKASEMIADRILKTIF